MDVYLLIHELEYPDSGDELRGVYARREDAEADRAVRPSRYSVLHGGCCRIEEREVYTESVHAATATA